jgi:alpha-tubulin suppressor-like RCC1 family protein
VGDGTIDERDSPVRVQGLSNAVSVGAGDGYSCALLNGGQVYCWGDDNQGELGDAFQSPHFSLVPVAVTGLGGVVGLDVGDTHVCAVRSDDSVYCWGYNAYGELGDGTTTNQGTPVKVQNLDAAKGVAAGRYFTCALLTTNAVSCWGNNTGGQLGDGTSVSHTSPAPTTSFGDVASIDAGTNHPCAVTTSGQLFCWGSFGLGDLASDVPAQVLGLPAVASVSAGTNHTCALTTIGTLYCWGDNPNGAIGDGTTDYRGTPTAVVGL